jgi:hypothetical protein
MAPSPQKGDAPQPPNLPSTVILMLTIADTTWRLFVPSVGLTIVGLVLDKLLGTTPWVMVAGIIIGIAIAIWLVRLQIKKVSNV